MLETRNRNGCRSASGTGGCASAGKMEAKCLGFGAETKAKNSSRTAGMGRTRAVGPRIGRQQSRADRGFKGNRPGLGCGVLADSDGRIATVVMNRRGRIATVG